MEYDEKEFCCGFVALIKFRYRRGLLVKSAIRSIGFWEQQQLSPKTNYKIVNFINMKTFHWSSYKTLLIKQKQFQGLLGFRSQRICHSLRCTAIFFSKFLNSRPRFRECIQPFFAYPCLVCESSLNFKLLTSRVKSFAYRRGS